MLRENEVEKLVGGAGELVGDEEELLEINELEVLVAEMLLLVELVTNCDDEVLVLEVKELELALEVEATTEL